MGFRIVVFISLAIFSFPFVVSAEEPGLLEVMCKQVLEPEEEKSVLGVVKDHFVSKFKAVPQELAADGKETADGLAETLAEKLEAQEPDFEVLGASVVNPVADKTLEGLAFLLKHWMWTLAALGIAAVIFMFL